MPPEIQQVEIIEPQVPQTIESIDFDEVLKSTPTAIQAAVLRLLQAPPVIEVVEPDEEDVINKMKIINEVERPRPTELTLFIPLYDGLPKLLLETKCSSIEELLEKIQSLAVKENLGYLTAIDPDARLVIVNLHKRSKSDYNRPMSPEDAKFIRLFDREVF